VEIPVRCCADKERGLRNAVDRAHLV
jgi:hypothetical protein